ncbi:MAG TPA: hypothetical protein VLH61_07695 [Bacteroidales bacterium]|nr:hypothetical protein [Bacteroidales bacterium]
MRPSNPSNSFLQDIGSHLQGREPIKVEYGNSALQPERTHQGKNSNSAL